MQIPTHKIDESKLFIKWRDIQIVPGSKEQAHRHNYFQFMFLEKVTGMHEIDFENYNAQNNSLHFVGKGRVHKVDFKSNVIGGVLLFPEEIFGVGESDLQLLSSFAYFKDGAHPTLKLATDQVNEIKNIILQIKETIANCSFDIGKYLLFALLAKVRDIYNVTAGEQTKKKLSTELIAFNKLLKEKACEWNSVEDFTTAMHITTARLNIVCKEYFGQTALQLLHQRKLLSAKRMLVYTDKQVKEIGYDCGFDDVAYFNRFFKKHVGDTPGTFRNNH